MSGTLRTVEQLTWIGLAVIGLGLAALLVASWVEALNNPGLSIVDGYWIGRLPWIPIGVGAGVAGATGTLLTGSIAALIRGDWVRRALILPVLALAALWWFAAIYGYPRYQPIDPVTFAYSWPEAAAIALILPALAIAALVFLPIRPDTRVRLRSVHPPPR